MKQIRRLTMVLACLLGIESAAQSLLTNHDFILIYRELDELTDKHEFYGTKVRGSEVSNNSLNRLSILSENQYNYPEPTSGCGPIAMLNILIWYEKYGLIKSTNRDSDTERYKQIFFREIDRRLHKQAGTPRSELKGTGNFDAAMVMDAYVRERSSGRLRIHTDFWEAPLKLTDLLDTMPNFRAGYLIVHPKDPNTGQLLELHATTLVRADRAGYISIGSWGQMYRGILKQKGGKQWLVAQEGAKTVEFQIVGMMRFIPFRPAPIAVNR